MNERRLSRRQMLCASAGAMALACAPSRAVEVEPIGIIDSHIHVWDLSKLNLSWLRNAGPLLNRDYSMADYREAAAGLHIERVVYVEVAVAPDQRQREAELLIELCRDPNSGIAGGVIGGNPADPGFADYIRSHRDQAIKGVRHSYGRGQHKNGELIKGLRLLGELGLSFDLLAGGEALVEIPKLVDQCGEMTFVLDHCGNPDVKWFSKESSNAAARDQWKRAIEQIARRKSVFCKISGLVESSVKETDLMEQVAPAARHCLECFGADRVLYASNWPVCLRGATLQKWTTICREFVADRPAEDRKKFFRENARRAYRLRD